MPACSTCLRTLARPSLGEGANLSLRTASGLQQHVRHASQRRKKVKPDLTIPVRLKKDVRAYGKRGSIVPIVAGQMRNEWYPRQIAEYIPYALRAQMKRDNVKVGRDLEYGVIFRNPTAKRSATLEAPPEAPAPPTPLIEKVSPERSMELLDIFVPARLKFHRTPILEEKTPELPETTHGASRAAEDLLRARAASRKSAAPQQQAIYGSVTATDVTAAVRRQLATNEEGSRVAISEEDITLFGTPAGDDPDGWKIKRIGQFLIEIQLKGAEQPLKRMVDVVAQGSE